MEVSGASNVIDATIDCADIHSRHFTINTAILARAGFNATIKKRIITKGRLFALGRDEIEPSCRCSNEQTLFSLLLLL